MITISNLKKEIIKRGGKENFRLEIPSLSIHKNEIVYFVGPNGSGKTVLLSLIQGVMTPDSGSVYVYSPQSSEKVDLLLLEPFERASYLGVVPQESDDALINEMSVVDHILIGLAKSQKLPLLFPKKRCKEFAMDVLRKFGLGFEFRLSEVVGNLSGGERQVLAFCLATIGKPTVLLLDEFTGALDPEIASRVLHIVISTIRLNELSALIVTHRHQEAISHADRIVVLHKGKPYLELNRSDDNFSETYLKEIFTRLYGYA